MGRDRAAATRARRRQAELDGLKEEIGHYKVWEAAGIAIFAGLIGWLASTESAPPLTFGLGALGVILTGIGILRVSRHIDRQIERIGHL